MGLFFTSCTLLGSVNTAILVATNMGCQEFLSEAILPLSWLYLAPLYNLLTWGGGYLIHFEHLPRLGCGLQKKKIDEKKIFHSLWVIS